MNDQEAKELYFEMLPRCPYVKEGQVVSSLNGKFQGGSVVSKVGSKLTRRGYVVRVRTVSNWGHWNGQEFFDTQLSCLHQEVPQGGTWHWHPGCGFKNVHEYVLYMRRKYRREHVRKVKKMLGRCI